MAHRSCEVCERYMFDDKIGEMGGVIRLDDGRPMDRPVGSLPPCHQCPKVPTSAPARTREHAIDPSERSRTAIEHYCTCKAVGRFPEDAIVERNAGILSQIEADAGAGIRREELATLIQLAMTSRGSR